MEHDSHVGDEADDTRNLEAPDADRLVEHMLQLVASEAEALLAGDDHDGRRADLYVRTALASWDALHQPDEAMRQLELAEGHPLAPRLRIAAALADSSPTALSFVQISLDARKERNPSSTLLALELAEAWLFRHGRAEPATTLLDKVLADPASAAYRGAVVELAVLANAALGNWPRVVELRRAVPVTPDAPAEAIASLAALLLDHSGDAAGALALCWAKLEHYPGNEAPDRLGWLRVFDLAIDAALAATDERLFELIDKRGELVAALPGGALEAFATEFAVAGELERNNQHADAAALWLELANDAAALLPGSARRVAQLSAAWAAAGARDRAVSLAAHRGLADSAATDVAATHAWRALELAAAISDQPAIAEMSRLLAGVAIGVRGAEWWVDRFELLAPTEATLARFEARGGHALRWAAAIAERIGQPARALDLWVRAQASVPHVGTTRDHVLRLHRGGERSPIFDGNEDDLATHYAAWAASEPDPRCASALWSARGLVDLSRGDFVEAEESLLRAAKLDPRDPFCRAALASVYRVDRRYDQLAPILAELSTSLSSREARIAAAREHAELLDEHLGDPVAARAAIERMIVERPDDIDAMLSLARLCERDELWDRAIALRSRAAEAAPAARKPDIYIDIARSETHRGNLEAALTALTKANNGAAMREQVRLLRASGDRDRALAICRAELAVAGTGHDRRIELQAEIAQLLTELGAEPEAIVAAYLEVLSIVPDQTEALANIEAPARRLGLWDELARAFRGAPQTPRNLEVLAEALEKIAEWSELAEVRRKQLEAAVVPAERAQRAGELARLYEDELGDTEAAIRSLLVAQAAVPDDARQTKLLTLLRRAERWGEVAAVLERELPTVRANDAGRQIAILVELGDLRSQKLGRPAEAVQAYEAALERKPDEPTSIAALEKLYELLGRDRELARLLEARAEHAADGPARSQQYARVATLRANRNDIDGALAAYTAAFSADPTNRDVFTAMERVCYKAERWAAAMQLYDTAITHVESGASRAYRLGDLYSRRGNVLLNFVGHVDAAIEAYQKVVEVDSQPASAVSVLEDLCTQRGDWQALITAYERRAETQKDPIRRADALRAAAQIANDRAGDARMSIRLNRKLLSIDPTDSRAHAILERHYEETQDRSGMIEVLKLKLAQAQTSGDNSVEILRKIARASESDARDVDSAVLHYQKILELQPDNRDALESLGRIYESTEQWAEFIDVTRRQIKVTTDRNIKALLYFRCGSVMEAKFGREQDAIRYYDAAIKTSSSCLPAVHGLRDLYRRREEWPRVIETLEVEVKLWQDDKERAGVFAQIGRIYDKQLGDADRAMQFYDSALSVDPDCLPANQALFEHYFDAKEWEKARPIANSLAQKAMRDGDPSTRSDFFRRRGVVAQMTGDSKGAADNFIDALTLKPTNTAALDDLNALARAHPDACDYDVAYKELEKLYKKREDAATLLARVHVGRAALLERDGDLDQAALLYREAVDLAFGELAIVSALVDFHTDMRRWGEAITALERFAKSETASPAERLDAMIRQATIHADCEMDAARAIAVLREIIRVEPSHQDAYYLLAQQLYLTSKYPDARAAIDRVIELATAPGQPLSASALARYYYYKGRILDAAGDNRAAAPQYRRATEYDPGYAPPALVLARRAADANDQRQAETILIEAAHAAMAQGGPVAAVPLQRGLARILLASGDRAAAIEAYRGILNVEPNSASDRVALAEIYAVDDPTRAIGELRKVLERDIHHAPAYRMLASFYSRTGDVERATRVLTALDLLGFAEDADRSTMQRLRSMRSPVPIRQPLADEPRQRLLASPAMAEPLGEVFDALAEEISGIILPPSLGIDLQPAQSMDDKRIMKLGIEVGQLFAIDVDVFVGDKVPGLAAATAFPRKLLVIDRSLINEPELSLRFLFGWAYESIRGGYALLLQLGSRQRSELATLLRALVTDGEVTGAAAELHERASNRAIKVLERHAGLREVDPDRWVTGMLAGAKRGGLLACDDFSAAIQMVARLAGERLANHDSAIALGAVLGGPDLVRFYLSDAYQQLRDTLTA